MKKAILLGVPIFLIFLSVYVLSQTEEPDEPFTITCDRDVYYCLQDCEAICTITNNLNRAVKINVTGIFPNYFGLELEEIYVLKEETQEISVPVTDFVNSTCYNGTSYGSWIDVGGYYLCNVTSEDADCLNLYSINFENDICEHVGVVSTTTSSVTVSYWSPFDQKWIILLPNNKRAIKGQYNNGGNGVAFGDTVKVKLKFEVPFASEGKFDVKAEADTGEYSILDPWWNSTWTYRREINITELSGNTLTDFQVLINVTYDSNMQPDFDDIRFTYYNSTDDTETEIPYWRYKYEDGGYAEFYVKVPYIPANGVATLYMYYGNSEVSTTSNYNDTSEYGFKVWESTQTPSLRVEPGDITTGDRYYFAHFDLPGAKLYTFDSSGNLLNTYNYGNPYFCRGIYYDYVADRLYIGASSGDRDVRELLYFDRDGNYTGKYVYDDTSSSWECINYITRIGDYLYLVTDTEPSSVGHVIWELIKVNATDGSIVTTKTYDWGSYNSYPQRGDTNSTHILIQANYAETPRAIIMAIVDTNLNMVSNITVRPETSDDFQYCDIKYDKDNTIWACISNSTTTIIQHYDSSLQNVLSESYLQDVRGGNMIVVDDVLYVSAKNVTNTSYSYLYVLDKSYNVLRKYEFTVDGSTSTSLGNLHKQSFQSPSNISLSILDFTNHNNKMIRFSEKKIATPEPTYTIGSEESPSYISILAPFAVNFTNVYPGDTNYPADGNGVYNVTIDTNCQAYGVWFYSPPNLTYDVYEIPNSNLKFNYTLDSTSYPTLQTLDADRFVNATGYMQIFPYYYLDVPSGQHAGDYSTVQTLLGICT